jgi:hypothetical protein
MSIQVFTNAKLLLGGHDISSDMNQLALSVTAEMLEKTTFGAGTRVYKGGLKKIRLTGAGLVQEGTDLVGPFLYDEVGAEDEVLSVWPVDIIEGSTSTGSGYAFKCVTGKYTPLAGGVGELLKFQVEAEGRGI